MQVSVKVAKICFLTLKPYRNIYAMCSLIAIATKNYLQFTHFIICIISHSLDLRSKK